MRLRNLTISAAAAGLVAVGLGLPSEAQELSLRCVGSVTGPRTLEFDLFVPAGRSCDLTDVTVLGNVSVRRGANLFTEGTTVEGNVVAGTDAFVNAIDSEIRGNLRLNSSFGGYLEDSTVGRVARSNGAGFLYSLRSDHGSHVRSTDGETFLETATVGGDLTTEGDLITDVYDSTISGDLSATEVELGTVICSSEVDGDATLRELHYVVQIGSGQPLGGCGFNVFGGDLILEDSTAEAGIYVSNNVVRGLASATGNDPAPVGQDNRFRGGVEGQFVDMESEPDPDATAGVMSLAEAEDRKADVLAEVDKRTAKGEKAVRAAGKAVLTR